VIPKCQYDTLERRRYIKFSTMLSREGGTEISLPRFREEVVHKFQYQALEAGWY